MTLNLTQKDIERLTMRARGGSYKSIKDGLGVSEGAIKMSFKRAVDRTESSNVVEVISKGVRDGIIKVFDVPCIDVSGSANFTPIGSIPISDKNIQVLQLLSQGIAIKNIAYEFSISESAIKLRIRKIKKTLGAKSIPHAVTIALNLGLIE